jgi:hypothetical protein
MTDDRLSELLDVWAEWMQEPSGPRGHARRSAVLATTASTDFEEMVEDVDRMQAKAVNAAIEDLPMVERVAVHHVKLASVWRLRYSIQAVYGSACAMLKVSLTERGIE